MVSLVNFLLSSKGIKFAGGAAAGAGSIIAVILGLHGDIKKEINEAETRSKEYARSQVEQATIINTLKFEYIANTLDEIKIIVKDNQKQIFRKKE